MLKCANNDFSEIVATNIINWISNPDNKKITKLFWDWNPVNESFRHEILPKL